MPSGYCPECDTEIKLGNMPKKGQKITCPSCGANLEVTSISPIELDWADEEGEENGYEYDFESDDDFDDDFEDYED